MSEPASQRERGEGRERGEREGEREGEGEREERERKREIPACRWPRGSADTGSTIRYLITTPRIPPYASSVLHTAYHHTLAQYRAPHTTTCYRSTERIYSFSTGHRIASAYCGRWQYSISIQQIALQSWRHTPPQYRTSHSSILAPYCTTVPGNA
eukprot:858560-Rhodomonas_salina.1